MRKIRGFVKMLPLAAVISISACKKDNITPTPAAASNSSSTVSTAPANSNYSNPVVPAPSAPADQSNTGNASVPNTAPSGSAGTSTATPAAKTSFMSVTGVPVYKTAGSNAFFYQTEMTIDADGAYKAYNENSDVALCPLSMGGVPGNWWALVTDANGDPVKQGPNDPAPGYYICMTSLEDPSIPATDPHRYVDALTTPYVVLPPQLKQAGGANLGDFGAIYNSHNGKLTYVIFADEGPSTHIGEASVNAAHNVGLELVNKAGGSDNGITYIVFPGSGNGSKRSVEEINAQGSALLSQWGGAEKLKNIFN
ncbi:MAG: glycoside hydrolase family 75 protein [Cytophagaceae bacterium]